MSEIAGHLVIEEPLRLIAAKGNEIHLVTAGLRKTDRRLPISFRQEIFKGLTEHRLVSALKLIQQSLSVTPRPPPSPGSAGEDSGTLHR